MFDSCWTFFCNTVKTPVGVRCPFAPVLTVERPIRTPLRYTYITWSGRLTMTTTGTAGETWRCQIYSPGFRSGLNGETTRPLVKASRSVGCKRREHEENGSANVRMFHDQQ